MADAAYLVLTADAATSSTGTFFIDDDVLQAAGVTDLDSYSVIPGSKSLMPDLFL
jgi:citronellol/citronellal dehydrogenase